MRLRTAFGVSRRRALLAFAASLALVAAAAEKNQVLVVPLNVKMGLWQMTYTTERNGTFVVHSVAPELLAKMRPEQRARTAARLKARANQGSQVETRHFCMTEQALKTVVFDTGEGGGACERTVLASGPQMQQFHEECGEGSAKRMVEGHVEAVDADTLKGSVRTKFDGANGATTNVEFAGRWVAADCGNAAH